MKKFYRIPLGRLRETLAALHAPERSAYKSGPGIFSDYTIQVWPTRQSMVRSIRMQQRRAPRSDNWKAVQALTPTDY